MSEKIKNFFTPCNHPDIEFEGSESISVKNLYGSY